MQIVVCKEYLLARLNNKFTLETKKLIRERAVVSMDYVERINNNYNDCGHYFEVDKEATEKYFAQSAEIIEQRAAAKESKNDIIIEAVSEAITSKIETRGRKPKTN